MKFKKYIFILLGLVLISLSNTTIFSGKVSYYIKPENIAKGSVFIILFQNLDEDKKYLLKIYGKREYNYKINEVKYYTLKLIGVPLNSPDKIKLVLLENDQKVFEHKLKLFEKDVGQSHIWVDNKYVNPAKSFYKKIQKEYEIKQKAKKTLLKERFFYGAPVYPVEYSRITTPYGYKRIYNKSKNSIHYGTDMAAPVGTPVKSIFSGKVVLTGDFYYSGKTIYIHHGDDLISFYAHLNQIKVKNNQNVKKGDIIGTVGKTGRSTGPHLHLSIYVNRISVDPMSLFKVMKVKRKK